MADLAPQTFPARMLHTVNKYVPFDTACVIEPLTVAVRAGSRSHLICGAAAVLNCASPNDTSQDVGVARIFVVVFGDGSIGLLLLQAAKAYGARCVMVVGNTPNRLAKARELGADVTFDCSASWQR